MIAAAEYEFIRRLVYDRSRINLGPDKIELVCSRLQKRVRMLNLAGLAEYCRLLRSPAGQTEVPSLLDAISTNVTEFFREFDHFEFLRHTALSEWMETRRSGDTFRLWSAGCASGEEAYSAAIVLSEAFRQQAIGWHVVGSDLSGRAVETARRGIYRLQSVRLPQPEWLRRYFQNGLKEYAGQCRIKPELRRQVEFHQFNLTEGPYPVEHRFDVVFCRNVMIYFDRKTQEQLVARLQEQLAQDGWLFVGHSESLVGVNCDLKCVRPGIYRKK